MVLRTFDGTAPTVHESAYVDDTAVIIGDVVIERGASIWPNATLRGDDGAIHIGRETSVQDNCVFHEGAHVESSVTVGHGAIVHGCTVEEGSLVGMGSTILTGAEIGSESVIAAGAVVTGDTTVPPKTLVAGVPAEPIRELDGGYYSDDDGESYYTRLARKHRETATRVDRSDLE